MQRSPNEILTNDLIAELERDTKTAIDDGEKETLTAYAHVSAEMINKILDALEKERWTAEKERIELAEQIERERHAHTQSARFFQRTINNLSTLIDIYRDRLSEDEGGDREIN